MFRDSDELVDFVWYPALDDAPVLPYPSIFLDGVWDDWDYEQDGVGLVYTPRIKNNWQGEKQQALAKHICGSATDFALGGVYDPEAPPVVYGTNGLPVCCGVANVDLGGIGMGGHVMPAYMPPAPPWTPGTTCATAAVAALDTVYTFMSATSGEQWIEVPAAVGGGGYGFLCQLDTPDYNFSIQLFHGTSCGSLVFQGTYNTNDATGIVVLSPGHAYFKIFPFGTSTPMHFQISTGYPIWTIYPHGGMGGGGKVIPTVTP